MPSIFYKEGTVLPDRREHDFYPTPYGICLEALKEASVYIDALDDNIFALDPGAGYGVWGKALKKLYPYSTLFGFDIQNFPKPDEYDMWRTHQDFLDEKFFTTDFPLLFGDVSPNLIIGNPPYKYAEEFIRTGIDFLRTNGLLIFLLRMDFLGSIKRGTDLFVELPPKHVIVSSRRPSFTGDKKTAGDNYFVGIWKKEPFFVGKPETKLSWFTWEYIDD